MRAEAAECMRQAKRLLAQVEEGRAAGNKYFGKKKYAEAIKCYSESLKVVPQVARRRPDSRTPRVSGWGPRRGVRGFCREERGSERGSKKAAPRRARVEDDT
jgi:hypothetical protein